MIRNSLAKIGTLLFVIVFGLPLVNVCDAALQEVQEVQAEAQETQATIRGSLVLDSSLVTEVDWEVLEGTIGQFVALQQPEFPEGWSEMGQPERRQWLTDFYETDDGKRLREANQKTLDDRFLEHFQIRSQGKFVVYDVPKGRFEFSVVGQTEVDGKTYVLQARGQFDVEEADELDFSNTKLQVLRLLKVGEEAPEITGASGNGDPLSLSDLRGKHVLLTFGLTSSPDFQLTTRSLKEAASSPELADSLEVLTVTVDENVNAVEEFNKANGVDWHCLNLGKWDQSILNSYGLRFVPSLWLIDTDGKIVLTGQQFVYQLNRTKFPVAKLVEEAIAGRLSVEGEGQDSAADDGRSR